MARVVYVPLDTYRVRFAAHCGMGYTIADELTYRDAVKRAAAFARKRFAQGYPVSTRRPQDPVEDNGWCLEISEPDDAAMVPDDAGYITVEQEWVRGRECWACGSPVRVDEPCCESDERDEYSAQFD